MKAALLTAPNTALELRDIEWQPLRYGQVLVKVLATGICGAQLQEVRGEKGNHFPRLLGHEACVEVLQCGDEVRSLKAGDRAVAHWRKGQGIESESPRWMLDGKTHTAGQITTFSQHSVISENRLTRVPEGTPIELCTLLGCGLSTALGTMENEANLRFGESVLIIGCGGLGLNLILAAKLRQASKIVVIETSEEKKAMAHSMGAHSAHPGFWGMENESYDVVIDTTGNADAISEGMKRIAPSGRFILVGQPKPRENVTLTNARHFFDGDGKSIIATQGGRFSPTLDIPRYVEMHKSGLLNLNGLITHRMPLAEINRGMNLVSQGQAGRVLIEP